LKIEKLCGIKKNVITKRIEGLCLKYIKMLNVKHAHSHNNNILKTTICISIKVEKSYNYFREEIEFEGKNSYNH